MMNNDNFWLNNPNTLIQNINQLWPSKSYNDIEKLNAISRVVILLSVLLWAVYKYNSSYLISGAVTLVFIVLYYSFFLLNETKVEPYEGFKDKKNNKKVTFQKVNDKNPMGNVLVTDYKDNVNKKEAPPAYEPTVIEKINKETKNLIKSVNPTNNEIDKRLFKDLGDNYMFEDSMHTFYSNPNTKIPNDQEGFANFCYGDMVSAKEGNDFAAIRNNPRYTNY